MITKLNKVICKMKWKYYTKLYSHYIDKTIVAAIKGEHNKVDHYLNKSSKYLLKQCDAVEDFTKDWAL